MSENPTPVDPGLLPLDEAALGERLRQARAAVGVSQVEVAATLGIPRSAVSLIESGDRGVSTHELIKLARLYHQPLEELLFRTQDIAPDDHEGSVLRYFRTAAPLRKEDERWLRKAEKQWHRYAELERDLLGAQHYALPTYPVPRGRPYEQGEHLAQQERRRLRLGVAPVRSMIDLLESEGVKVLLLPFPGKTDVSGCYFFSDDYGPCVLINDKEISTRRRFTAAHEYCHFLVDREQTEGEMCAQNRQTEPFERRANSFAAAFLLPADGVMEALYDSDVSPGAVEPEDVISLMYRFGVSYEAVLWRLLNLGWISRRRRAELSELSPTALAADLGYPQEAGGQETRPDRFQKLALEAWRSKQISLKDLAELLEVSPQALKKAFGGAQQRETQGKQRSEEATWF